MQYHVHVRVMYMKIDLFNLSSFWIYGESPNFFIGSYHVVLSMNSKVYTVH